MDCTSIVGNCLQYVSNAAMMLATVLAAIPVLFFLTVTYSMLQDRCRDMQII